MTVRCTRSPATALNSVLYIQEAKVVALAACIQFLASASLALPWKMTSTMQLWENLPNTNMEQLPDPLRGEGFTATLVQFHVGMGKRYESALPAREL